MLATLRHLARIPSDEALVYPADHRHRLCTTATTPDTPWSMSKILVTSTSDLRLELRTVRPVTWASCRTSSTTGRVLRDQCRLCLCRIRCRSRRCTLLSSHYRETIQPLLSVHTVLNTQQEWHTCRILTCSIKVHAHLRHQRTPTLPQWHTTCFTMLLGWLATCHIVLTPR